MNTEQLKKTTFKTKGLKTTINFFGDRIETINKNKKGNQVYHALLTILGLVDDNEDQESLRKILNSTNERNTKQKKTILSNEVFGSKATLGYPTSLD